jgi:hypothetical protein
VSGLRLLTIAVLLVLIVGARLSLRTWGNPVSALAGSFALTLSWQQAVIPDVPFGAKAALLIIVGAVALFIGTAISTSFVSHGDTVDLRVGIAAAHRRTVRLAVWGAVAFSFLYLAYLYKVVEIERTDYINDVFYREAFSVGPGSGLLYRIAQLLMYVGAMVVALDAAQRGLGRKEPLLFLAGATAQSIVLSTKFSILLILSIFAVVWTLTHAASLRRLFTPRHVFVAGLLVVVGLYSFDAVTSRRAGGDARFGATFAYSFSGASSALSLVVDQGFRPDPDPIPGMTVGGLRELVGGSQRQFGVYLYAVTLKAGEYQSSINVYTWYLPFLQDLGVVGALALVFMIGFVTGPLFVRAREGMLSVTALVVLTCLVLLLLWAPISLLSYYNFWFGLLILAPVYGALFKKRATSQLSAPPPRRQADEKLVGRGIGAGWDRLHMGVDVHSRIESRHRPQVAEEDPLQPGPPGQRARDQVELDGGPP